MGLVVTGISQAGDIAALEAALKNASLPLDRVQIIGPTDSDTGAVGRIAGPQIMTGDGGTGVPGLGGGQRGMPYFRQESMSDRLGDLEIPDSEVDNYVDALEAGRTIVAYFARPENIGAVEEIFRNSGFAKIKTF